MIDQFTIAVLGIGIALLTVSVVQNHRARLKALEIARRYGGIDGDHHKAWVIDQMVRALTPNYRRFVADAKAGEDGPETYTWDTGIAP